MCKYVNVPLSVLSAFLLMVDMICIDCYIVADTLYWAGDFETCNLSQWEDVLEAEPGRYAP